MTEPSVPATKRTELDVALLGGFAKNGPWRKRRRTVAISPVGGIDLDLTEATLPGEAATVVKVSIVGGARLTLPAGVNVVVKGFNLIGGRPGDTGPMAAGAPTVRLHAYGVVGGVRLERV